MERNVWCKDCGTILGESQIEWASGHLIREIQPYIFNQIKDGIIDCPICSNKVDISKKDSVSGQLSFTLQYS